MRRAFSLIELLVVISIIALLIALRLVPRAVSRGGRGRLDSVFDQIIALRTETHVNMACSITDLILCEHENALLVDDHAVVQNRFNYYRTGGETKGEQSGGYTLHITKRNLEFDKNATRAENTFRTKIHEAYGTPEPAWPMPILRQPNAAAAAIAAADQIEIIKHVLSKV